MTSLMYIWYIHAKFHHDPSGNSRPNIRESVPTRLLFITFCVGSCNSPQPRLLHQFLRTLRHTTRFLVRMYLFRIKKKSKKLIFRPLIAAKPTLGTNFDGT